MTGRRNFFIALMLGAVLALPACSGGHQKSSGEATIFLVRHAEKETTGDDPDLTKAGYARAERLARLLQREKIKAIWSTDYRRTKETASPLSKLIGIPVQIYDPSKLEEFAEELEENGETALVVGHSNTTPELVELLGGDAGEAIDEAAEYDRLYVLSDVGKGGTRTEIRRYGTPYVDTGNE